jgi:signal transduction histidine kinase
MDANATQILLVEDDPGHSHLIRQAINKASSDYRVTCVESITAAVVHLRSEDLDAVITDLSLPDGTGLDSVKMIREQNATVPIVVLTMLEDSGTESAALDFGAQDYLPKNQATPEVLRRAIQHAILRQQCVAQTAELLEKLNASRRQLEQQKKLLKRKNRRLKRLYDTAQRFVDNVSHEFRTPLTVIKDYVLLVREGMCGEVNAEQAHMLDVAAVRVNDLNTMVDDMLDVSKLEAGMLGAWRRRCRLSEIVEAVAPALRQKAAVREVAFEIDVPDDLPEIYCDAEKVGRVVINLVVNAIKFCGEAGQVRLSALAERDTPEVIVAVADNGRGISAPDLERIFQRFEQLNCDIRQSTKGFGLGLNIAQELTAINLGQMRVESQPGQGSTFSFSIPLADPREVVRRYLHQIRMTKRALPLVSVFTIETDESTPLEDADDVDLCLTGLLRQNDLMWRLDTHSWLIVIATNEAEAARFLQRLEDEHKSIDCRRPGGALPRLQTTRQGTWRAADQSEEILNRLDRLFMPAEFVGS